MKTFTKNLISKIEHLQKCLLFYSNITTTSEKARWLYVPFSAEEIRVNHDAARKFYQFKL